MTARRVFPIHSAHIPTPRAAILLPPLNVDNSLDDICLHSCL